jgi:hypothetical protein
MILALLSDMKDGKFGFTYTENARGRQTDNENDRKTANAHHKRGRRRFSGLDGVPNQNANQIRRAAASQSRHKISYLLPSDTGLHIEKCLAK